MPEVPAIELDRFALRMADFSIANLTQDERTLVRYLLEAGYPQPGHEVVFTTELSVFGLFLFHAMLGSILGSAYERVGPAMIRFSWLANTNMRRSNGAPEIPERDWNELIQARYSEYSGAMVEEWSNASLSGVELADCATKHLTGLADVDAQIALHVLAVVRTTVTHVTPAISKTWQSILSRSAT